MTKQFRPLLAATLETPEQLQLLRYPIIGSPKVDGIRVVCHPQLGPVTRSLKPIKNHHVRGLLSHHALKYFDGEITLGPANGPTVFNDSIRATQTHDTSPDISYHVFDYICLEEGQHIPYENRHTHLGRKVISGAFSQQFPFIKFLPCKYLSRPEGVIQYEQDQVSDGYEGIMLRDPQGKYKHGRSTFKEQILLKMKRWQDDEATVIGFEALQRNTNPQTRNQMGLAERSSHKANRIDDSLLGTLLVSHDKWGVFGIGSGLDVALREEIWEHRDRYLGKTVTFKYLPHGTKDAPRFPIFKCFRED